MPPLRSVRVYEARRRMCNSFRWLQPLIVGTRRGLQNRVKPGFNSQQGLHVNVMQLVDELAVARAGSCGFESYGSHHLCSGVPMQRSGS